MFWLATKYLVWFIKLHLLFIAYGPQNYWQNTATHHVYITSYNYITSGDKILLPLMLQAV